MGDSDEPQDKSSQKDMFGEVVEGLLKTVDPGVRRAIRLAAIPHRFDTALLAQLAGPESGRALDLIEAFRFATRDARGNYRYREEVRRYLADWWRQNLRGEYLAAHRAAYEYLIEAAQLAPPLEKPILEREAIYHLLVVDENKGLRTLEDLFENAYRAYQLNTAEQLVKQLVELRDQLSEAGQAWVRYFEGALDLIYRRGDRGVDAFIRLAEDSPGQVLQALARWKLGQVRVSQRKWSAAVQQYRSSVKILESQKEAHNKARVLMSLGKAYCDLGDESGGFQEDVPELYGRISLFLQVIEHLPFLAYEWLVHRVSFLPNWYFGTNYQDWIVAYLYTTGAGDYRRAEEIFAAEGDWEGVAEARLSLARIDHDVGRWSRAQKRFEELLAMEEIRLSQYLIARVRLEQGQAYLKENRLQLAATNLEQTAGTFVRFDDERHAGQAYYHLALAHYQAGNRIEAAESLLKSAIFFEASGEQLAQTRAIWRLEHLVEVDSLSNEQQKHIFDYLQREKKRYTISRFPQAILHWYRRLALLGALPLTYLLLIALAVAVSLLLIVLEVVILSSVAGVDLRVLSVPDVLILAGWAMLPLPLAFWMYRLIYSLMGWVVVRILGRRLVPIEREQPAQITLDEYAVTRSSKGEEDRHMLAWEDISALASVDFKILRHPIQLISRTLLLTASAPMTIEGTTAGYLRVKGDLRRYISARGTAAEATRRGEPEDDVPAGSARFLSYDFTFLHRAWLLSIVGLSAVLGYIYHISLQAVEITGALQEQGELRLQLSSLLAIILMNLLFLLPASVLFRLAKHRRRLERELGYRAQALSTRTIETAAGLVTLLWLVWILLLSVASLSTAG